MNIVNHIFRHKKRPYLLPQFFPIISQPRWDTYDNGLYAVYFGNRNYTDFECYTQEVTLVFNNEYYPKNSLINRLYAWFRKLWYGRHVDIETFILHVVRGELVGCSFPNIYSGSSTWEETVHGDSTKPFPIHSVERYFCGEVKNPMVFVNTWNHALAMWDTNRLDIEDKVLFYIYEGLFKNVKTGFLSREQVEKKYKNCESI